MVLVIRVNHLTLLIYLWDLSPIVHVPILFVEVQLLENSRLVVTTAHGKHEANWAPSAFPARLVEGGLEGQDPLSSFLIGVVIFPDPQFLIFSTRGYQVLHNANIVAPVYVSDPVVVGWASLPTVLELSLELEFIGSRVLLPYFRFVVHGASHKPFAYEGIRFFGHWLLALKIIVLSQQETRLAWRSPGQACYSTVMSLQLFSSPVSLLIRNNMHRAISDSSCQEESILPRTKFYCVYRSLCFVFVNAFPLIILNLFPELNLFVIATCGNNGLVFGVSPSDWPAGALMGDVGADISVYQLWSALRNNLVALHPANLDYAIAVGSSQSCSKEIKLWVILFEEMSAKIILVYLRSFPYAQCRDLKFTRSTNLKNLVRWLPQKDVPFYYDSDKKL